MLRSTAKSVFLFLLFSFYSWLGEAQVSTSLQNTNFNSCGTNLPQSELILGDFELSEALATDFSAGTFTFYIQAPTNFEINATSIAEAGNDITAASVIQNPSDISQLQITLTVNAQTSLDLITIENVRIRLISGATVTDGNLKYSLNGNANSINGLADNQTLANISFEPLTGGSGVNQQVCATADVQNISVTGSNITQSRTFMWEKEVSGSWTAISNSNSEILAVDRSSFPNGISKYRRLTTFTINGETCTQTSSPATITVNEIYPGSITEGTGQNVCATETPQQLSASGDVAVAPTGTTSYQWFKNENATWELIVGATDNFYQPSPLSVSTSFKRRFTNVINGFSCFKETPAVTVIVNATVLGGTATDQNICELNDLQLLTINNGENNGTYQWQKKNLGNWENISGATQNAYDASANINPGVQEFRRITTISGASCEGISTVATVAFSNFEVGNISGVQTICTNEVPNTLVSDTDAKGNGTISYQWEQFNGTSWSAISSANNTDYQPLAQSQSTLFRRQDNILLNGNTCSGYTNEIEITVLDQIDGGDASADQTVCGGEVPTAITIANGTAAAPNISYQWQSKTNGSFTNISGETDAVLSFATAPNATTYYRRQTLVTDNAKVCFENSSETTVFVNNLTIGVIGNDQDICSGGAPDTIINLGNTVASGLLSYSWEESTDNGVSWSTISGASGATFTPGTLMSSTKYRRLDTSTLNGKACSDYTNEVAITMAGAIAGGDGSADQVVCEGEVPVTISVANGTAAGVGINFQWLSSPDDVNYSVISGEAGETLSFSTGFTSSFYFKRKVSFTSNGTVCEATSTPTLVTLLSLSEGAISQTQTICGTENVGVLTSTTDAASNGTISYTWQSSPEGDTWTDIAGADQATYAPNNSGNLETYFRRKATAELQTASCEAITEAVIVYVNKFEDPINHRITFASGDTGETVVCNGGDPQPFRTNFQLIASGNLSYQWQVSDDNITYTNISGAIGISYDPPQVTQDNFYRRVTTTSLNGLSCNTTSNVLKIKNGGSATPGSIEINGANEEVICEGGDPSEIVELTAATGQALTYKWFANNTLIAGANGINYDPPAGQMQTTTYYRTTYSEDISGAICAVESNSVVVLVPRADSIGDDITICAGIIPPTLGDLNTIEGLPYLTFQWYYSNDGVSFSTISGATGPTYSPDQVPTSNEFYRRGYVATVDGVICGPEKLSNTVEIIINEVDAGSIAGNQQICFGEDPGLLASNVNGSTAGVLRYQWYSSEDQSNWSLIDNAVNSGYNPPAGSYPTTYFKRTTFSNLNNVSCFEESNIVVVEVAEELLSGTLSSSQIICEGEVPETLTVVGGSTFADQTYTWFASPDGVIWTDISVSTATYTSPIPTETTFYKRRISRPSFPTYTCDVETNPVKVTLNAVYAGKITDNQSVCEGSQPLAIVELESANGEGDLTYQWWSSPDNQTYAPVPGATQQNYTPPTSLITSTYFKRVVTSTLSGVACADETSPKLVRVIPYPIIDNEEILDNDITNVSCFGGNDGSIVIPNSRITGGNTAQTQINTVTLLGTPELNNTYSIIINGLVYEHQVGLNVLNQTQNNSEVATALAQEINSATGADLSEVNATTNANELLLTAKVTGVPFTAFASTGSATNASASNVITQPNGVANSYEWTKIGDTGFSASTLSISDLTAGVYLLTVYNEVCGITSLPFLVSEPDLLELTIENTCDSAITASSTGGIAPFTYTLTRPNNTTLVQTSNNPNITYTNLQVGATYSVSVKGATCNQVETESVTLSQGLQFDAASVVVENASCFGENDGTISLNIGATTVTGGFPPYNFSWAGPNNATYATDNISNLVPGVYVLSVTDQIGCSTTFTANIASKALLEISNVQVTNEQLQCAGNTNAEISIQVSSDPSSQLQIAWFKNGTSFATNNTNLTNLGAGSYEVVIKDTNSDPIAPCTVRQTFVISAPEIFDAKEVVSETPGCIDANTRRSFTFTAQGGTPPYQYTVDNGTPVLFTSTETTINSLSNDGHVIDVTDTNQCVVETFTMNSYEALSYTGVRSQTIAACEASMPFVLNTNLVVGGAPFTDANNNTYYVYDWTGPNNFVAQDITAFEAVPGTYSLTISDSKNCTSEVIAFTFNTTYEPIEVTKTLDLVSCGATDDGAISVAISGGLRPYAIAWEKETVGTSDNADPVFVPLGQNITQLNNLEEGRYRLTVTSTINGCTEADPAYYYREIITLNKTESLKLVDGPFLDEALCAGKPGSISVSVFNNQGGDLSFYYDNALMPSLKVDANTYSVQIANPLANASLNVVNDEGCGFTVPVSSGVTAPEFNYSSEEFEVTGLLLTKEDIRFNITNELGAGNATWDFGDGSPVVNVDPNTDGTQVIHNFAFPGIFNVKLTLFNEQGCSETVSQEVQIGNGYDVIFPNVFSANADGINDYFQGEFTGIASFVFQIFDNWGALVYEVVYDFDDMPVNWGWDGTYSSGKPFTNKSFRYLFVGTTKDNSQITKTGEAAILR